MSHTTLRRPWNRSISPGSRINARLYRRGPSRLAGTACAALALLVLLGTTVPALAARPLPLPAGHWAFDWGDCEDEIIRDGSPGESCGYLEGGAYCVTRGNFRNQFNPLRSGAVFFNGNEAVVRVDHSWRHEFGYYLSIAAWIRPENVSAPHQTIVSQGTWGQSFSLALTTDQVMANLTMDNGIEVFAVSEHVIPPLEWSHVAFVSKRGYNVEIYVNGSKVKAKVLKPSKKIRKNARTSMLQQTTYPIYIGNDLEHGFNGLIDEVRLYDSVLRQAQIKVLADVDQIPEDPDQQGQIFRFGGDTNLLKTKGDPPTLHYPFGRSGLDFYLGHIGSSDFPCQIVDRAGHAVFPLSPDHPEYCDLEATNEQGENECPKCQFTAEAAFEVGPEKTYAYYWVRGPNAGTGSGEIQAKDAIERLDRYRNPEEGTQLIGGNVLFADIEHALTDVDSGWEECAGDAVCEHKNRTVLESFLQTIADERGLTPGVYTRPQLWNAFFGSDFVPLDRRGKPLRFVLWISGCSTRDGSEGQLDEFRPASVLAASYATIMDTVLGGMRPSLWQYHIERDFDLTIQNPERFAPVSAFDVDGSRVSYSCTCGHLPDGSCWLAEGCSPWIGPEWTVPYNAKLEIHYDFEDEDAFNQMVVPNVAKVGRYPGLVYGPADRVAHFDGAPELGYAIDLEEEQAFMEADATENLGFSRGLAIEAEIRRDTDNTEDAILGKWYGADQWLLTLYPDNKLIFTVRLRDGTYQGLEYVIPDSSYLGTWVHVAASYEIINRRLGLFWDGRLVAERILEGYSDADATLYRSYSLIHVCHAGLGAYWSRFDGRIDDVKIWRLRKIWFD